MVEGPGTADGEDDGGGEGNREAPPEADTWVFPCPAEAVAVAGDHEVGWLEDEYSETGSGRCARGVVECCRDLLTER